MKMLAGIIFVLLLKKSYVGSRVDRYHPYSINESAGKCYHCIIIENHW